MMTSASIVHPHRFVQATRDSGYRDIASAVSELIDNSLQAGATDIDILITGKPESSDAAIAVIDNGSGMTPSVLRASLRFGGSDRFNDRQGLGRFGMGLPNSSLSQSRCVEVYSWRGHSAVWHTYLDIDQLATIDDPEVPIPLRIRIPTLYRQLATETGTIVIWNRLDRITQRMWQLLPRRLHHRLGQTYRFYLWKGTTIRINGEVVKAIDPLFLYNETVEPWMLAEQYGETIRYEFAPALTGSVIDNPVVEVKFSELPVKQLAELSDNQKRQLGVVNGAGVSIVRCDREIDYGWFFIDKRRENYDDWWRCEIRFSPEIDEMFGVTHTKQGARPADKLRQLLKDDLTNIARELNRRARASHSELALGRVERNASHTATLRDVYLPPLAMSVDIEESIDTPLLSSVESLSDMKYVLLFEELDEKSFYRTDICQNEVHIVLNSNHEFFRYIYQPITNCKPSNAIGVGKHIALLLMALARTEAMDWTDADRDVLVRFRHEWSRTISIFCGGRVPW